MADGTKIEWTEATWNPITGCSVTSPGCTNCYAMKLAGTRLRHHASRGGLTRDSKAGPVWTGEVRFNEQWLDQPLRWRKSRMIFVCAHGDLFHESVPDDWVDKVFAVMALAPQHTFQVLTKRSARMRDYFDRRNANGHHPAMDRAAIEACTGQWDTPALHLVEGWPLPNVWLGVSVEDQQRAAERIPDLLSTPAALRWLSCEPLLGGLDLTCADDREEMAAVLHFPCWLDSIDWVVVGGESGKDPRPMRAEWAQSLRDQCTEADVPFFFKQWGNYLPAGQQPDTSDYPGMSDKPWVGPHPLPTTKKFAGRRLDGVTHDAMPEARK